MRSWRGLKHIPFPFIVMGVIDARLSGCSCLEVAGVGVAVTVVRTPAKDAKTDVNVEDLILACRCQMSDRGQQRLS